MGELDKVKDILFEDLVLCNITHENAPPHRDCFDDCDVLNDNRGQSLGGHGKIKHKKCMDYWSEYIDELVEKIIANSY